MRVLYGDYFLLISWRGKTEPFFEISWNFSKIVFRNFVKFFKNRFSEFCEIFQKPFFGISWNLKKISRLCINSLKSRSNKAMYYIRFKCSSEYNLHISSYILLRFSAQDLQIMLSFKHVFPEDWCDESQIFFTGVNESFCP